MFSQIVKCEVDPSRIGDLQQLIDKWAAGAGKRLKGCTEILVSRETVEPHRVAVTVVFDDKDSLDGFSADRESLELFESVKPLLKGKLDFYEAHLHRASLV